MLVAVIIPFAVIGLIIIYYNRPSDQRTPLIVNILKHRGLENSHYRAILELFKSPLTTIFVPCFVPSRDFEFERTKSESMRDNII